jgi:hypothetical protein
MWNGYANRFDLARLRLKHFAHPFDTAPLGIHEEWDLAVCAAEHASESGSVVNDSLHHFASLAHAQTLRLTPETLSTRSRPLHPGRSHRRQPLPKYVDSTGYRPQRCQMR